MSITKNKLPECINDNTKVKDVIRILENNEMDSFTVEQSESFSGRMDRTFYLEDLKSENPEDDIDLVIWTEKQYADDYDDLDTHGDVELDFDYVNQEIRENNRTKITTGQDLLEYATNNLPDEIPINLEFRSVQLNTKVGDLDVTEFCSYDLDENTVKTVNKSDVLKTISSDIDKWTQKIKEIIEKPSGYITHLDSIMNDVIETTCDDFPTENDVKMSVDCWSVNFTTDFKINNDKYSISK